MAKSKSIVSALLVMLLWGSLFSFVKLGYGAYGVASTGDILFFAGVRFIICGALICVFAFIRNRRSFIPIKTTIVPVLCAGLFSIVLHYAFTYLGLSLTDSSKTAILKQVGVLFYVCFSWLFFKDDRVTWKKIIGAVLGFAGIIAISSDGGNVSFSIGDAFIIAASFCTVFANIISKRVFKSVDPIVSTGVSQLFGGIVLLVAGAILGGSMSFSFNFEALIMVYICIASIISYCIWFTVVKNGELSKLFIIKFAEPVFAAIFGAILLGENIFRPEYAISFLLIAAGIYISNK